MSRASARQTLLVVGAAILALPALFWTGRGVRDILGMIGVGLVSGVTGGVLVVQHMRAQARQPSDEPDRPHSDVGSRRQEAVPTRALRVAARVELNTPAAMASADSWNRPVIEISNRAASPWHIESDALVSVQEQADGVWLVARADRASTCELGGLPLTTAALPVTSRSKVLSVLGGHDEVEHVSLAEFALAGPTGVLRPTGRGGDAGLVAHNGVVAVVEIERRDPMSADKDGLHEILVGATNLFLPGAQLIHAINALDLLIGGQLEQGLASAALLGAGSDGTVTAGRVGEVEFAAFDRSGLRIPAKSLSRQLVQFESLGPGSIIAVRMANGTEHSLEFDLVANGPQAEPPRHE